MGFCDASRRKKNGEDRQQVRRQDRLVRRSSGPFRPLSWTHPREVEEQKLAPRTVIYPMEASEFMDRVKAGQQHMLPPNYEQLGASVAQMCDICALSLRGSAQGRPHGRQMDPVSPNCSPALSPIHSGRRTRTSQSARTARGCWRGSS
jgi:hypothetical protein